MTGLVPALGTSGTGTNGLPGLIICSSNLPDTVSIAVDTQMDDGVRTKGGLRAQLNAAPNPVITPNAEAAPDLNNYVQNGTNVYTMCRSL
jgi:hypothetical protein